MDAERLAMIGALVQQQNQNLLRLQQAVDRRRRERRRRDRVVWVRQWILRRPEHGLYEKLMVELRNEDPRAFQHFMRMPPAMFDELVQRLTPRLTKQDTNYAWSVPHNTVSVVVREVVEAIIEEYTDELLFCPTTEQGWRDLADQWYQRWNFPYTVGAIDGKYVACKAPRNSAPEFYNYKGFQSVILFAMVDADYKFTYIDVSGNGSSSDAQIYNESDLHRGLDQNRIHGFPQPDLLPNDNQDVPYFIIGNDAFSLRTYLMKPYSTRNLTHEERIFNYRLSRARWVMENAFGILTNRFQILLTTMQHHHETVRIIVEACCILHNLMRTRYPVLQNRLVDRAQPDGNLQPGAWREGQNLDDTVVVQGPNTASRDGKRQRNLLKHWCNSPAGSVDWQERMVAIN
ncbi:putative nuclease HARBI1 [Macrobrachium nipponense]|uniref:putative nuclease HARBI1 n=1 Tax=Macrobrachium nipponense TaxID=159736 RepID=UPI0030C7F204